MANISLNSQSLIDAANKIADAADRIDAAIAKIDATVSDLDSVWKDKNAKTYLARYEELKNEHFTEFKQAAHNYSVFLNKVVEAYRSEFVDPTSESVN